MTRSMFWRAPSPRRRSSSHEPPELPAKAGHHRPASSMTRAAASLGRGPSIAGKREFKPGDAVRSLTRITNDGIYPHRDIGETLVNGRRYRRRPRKLELSGRESTTRSSSLPGPPSSSCAARRWREPRCAGVSGRRLISARQLLTAWLPAAGLPAIWRTRLASPSACWASARMRVTMDRNPLERCGVRCSRRPSRSNRAIGSAARYLAGRLAGDDREQDGNQPAHDVGVAVAAKIAARAVRLRNGLRCRARPGWRSPGPCWRRIRCMSGNGSMPRPSSMT